MRHEPSGSLPPVQPVADWRCPACRVVRPLDDFPTARGSAAGVVPMVPVNGQQPPPALSGGQCGHAIERLEREIAELRVWCRGLEQQQAQLAAVLSLVAGAARSGLTRFSLDSISAALLDELSVHREQ